VDGFTDWLTSFVSEQNNPIGLLVLATAAWFEYVFPPFPGDTLTLFGAVLITAYQWSLFAVYGAVMVGSITGAMLAYYAGVKLQSRRERKRRGRLPAARIDDLVRRFERHGAWYLVLNRFMPSFRALFFVAAGMARIPPRKVALYAAISAGVWNALIIGAGALIGANFDDLRRWAKQYTVGFWVLAGTVIAVATAAHWWRRRRSGAP